MINDMRIEKICRVNWANWSQSCKSGESNRANRINLYCESSESSQSSESSESIRWANQTNIRINIHPICANWMNIDMYIHNIRPDVLDSPMICKSRITDLIYESRSKSNWPLDLSDLWGRILANRMNPIAWFAHRHDWNTEWCVVCKSLTVGCETIKVN